MKLKNNLTRQKKIKERIDRIFEKLAKENLQKRKLEPSKVRKANQSK